MSQTKKRPTHRPTPTVDEPRKRVMLSLSDEDYAHASIKAKTDNLPLATYIKAQLRKVGVLLPIE